MSWLCRRLSSHACRIETEYSGRFHETPRNLRIIADEIVHRPRSELRRIMRRKSSLRCITVLREINHRSHMQEEQEAMSTRLVLILLLILVWFISISYKQPAIG